MTEEADAARSGEVSPHKVSMSSFLMTGLDIEDQQYVYHSLNLSVLIDI